MKQNIHFNTGYEHPPLKIEDPPIRSGELFNENNAREVLIPQISQVTQIIQEEDDIENNHQISYIEDDLF